MLGSTSSSKFSPAFPVSRQGLSVVPCDVRCPQVLDERSSPHVTGVVAWHLVLPMSLQSWGPDGSPFGGRVQPVGVFWCGACTCHSFCSTSSSVIWLPYRILKIRHGHICWKTSRFLSMPSWPRSSSLPSVTQCSYTDGDGWRGSDIVHPLKDGYRFSSAVFDIHLRIPILGAHATQICERLPHLFRPLRSDYNPPRSTRDFSSLILTPTPLTSLPWLVVAICSFF